MADHRGALDDVRVVDLTDERAIYGAKLLADLGADVVRPEPPGGDPLRERGPRFSDPNDTEGADGVSLWHAYYASNRRFVSLDVETEPGARQLQTLAGKADLVILTTGTYGTDQVDVEQARRDNPALVAVECPSFGPGPWQDYRAPDLVAGALGGSVFPNGDVDTPPLKTFGDLTFITSGTYVAIAALAALRHARETGEGQNVRVPVHNAIASCLEHVFLWYFYNRVFPKATSKALERRGSLHFSNLYVVMQAMGGSIMATPTPDIDRQLVWLIEEGFGHDLLDPKYQQREHRDEFAERLMATLAEWVVTKDVEELFYEAQRRHSPYGWVLPIEKVAENPQLEARDWWKTYDIGGNKIQGPGEPYRFGETPWTMGDYQSAGTSSADVVETLGWGAEQETPA